MPAVASILIVTCPVAGAQKADSQKSSAAQALKNLNGKTPAEYESQEKESAEMQISKTVKHCVAEVRRIGKCGPETCAQDSDFYKNFDAFYNSAADRVENNVTLQGERKPLFVFNKCMAEKGLPLK